MRVCLLSLVGQAACTRKKYLNRIISDAPKRIHNMSARATYLHRAVPALIVPSGTRRTNE